MKVEILLSTYNRLGFLQKAINSILSQTYVDFICTVVNSGSTDGTQIYLDSIDDGRVQVIEFGDNLGISKNIERAIMQSSAQYVVLFHDDDIMEPFFLDTYMKSVENKCVLYHCNVTYIDGDDNQLERQMPPVKNYIEKNDYARLVVTDRNKASIVMPTVMLDTKMIKDANCWPLILNPELTMLVDMGIWLKVNQVGHFKFISKQCLKYRLHNYSETQILSKSFKEMLNNRWVILGEFLRLDNRISTLLFASIFILKSIIYDFKIKFSK